MLPMYFWKEDFQKNILAFSWTNQPAKLCSKLRMRKILWYWPLEDEKMEILMWGVNVSASGGEQDTKNADKECLEISSSSTEEMNMDHVEDL